MGTALATLGRPTIIYPILVENGRSCASSNPDPLAEPAHLLDLVSRATCLCFVVQKAQTKRFCERYPPSDVLSEVRGTCHTLQLIAARGKHSLGRRIWTSVFCLSVSCLGSYLSVSWSRQCLVCFLRSKSFRVKSASQRRSSPWVLAVCGKPSQD